MFRTNTNPRPPAAPHFATFLLPSLRIPFLRRRQSPATTPTAVIPNDVPSLSSSPTSTASTDDLSLSPTSISGVDPYTLEIPDDKLSSKFPTEPRQLLNQQPHNPDHYHLTRDLPDVLRCNTCGTDVAYGLQIVSKGFTGRHGRALLVSAPLATSTPSCPGSPPTAFLANGGNNKRGGNIPVSPGHHAVAHESTNLVNITVGRPEPRNLVTGAHVVADINCATCGAKIGWKYVDAREQAQKYKVGKFILETERVALLRAWDDIPVGEGDEPHRHFYSSSAPVGSFGTARKSSGFVEDRKMSYSSEGACYLEVGEEDEEEESGGGESEEDIVFDSDDEEECEDIFAGVWDAATVARRRESKVSGNSRNSAKTSWATTRNR